MIQRTQSLFLLGTALLSLILFYLPVYELQTFGTGANAAVTGTEFKISTSAILVIVNGAVGVLSFLSIFIYKNRNIQLRMTNLALLLSCVLIALLFFAADTMSSGMNQKIHYLYGSYLPLIEVILLFLASRFIKRDEDLVRSADRLR